jgi:plasmid stability protein
MATLQVKEIDDRLYTALKEQAKRDRRSISQEVVAMIEDYLAQPGGMKSVNATEEFLSLAGTWEDERDPDEIVREIREERHSFGRFTDEMF